MLRALERIITSRSIPTPSRGRRYALLERLDECLVVGLGVDIAVAQLLGLLLESASLLIGIVDSSWMIACYAPFVRRDRFRPRREPPPIGIRCTMREGASGGGLLIQDQYVVSITS